MVKILVVDDEPDMLEILKLVLEEHGYEVHTSLSGYECLSKAGRNSYDLILLDIRMPGMDGWVTLRKLKEKGITKKSKIMVLTVEKGPGTEIFGLQDVVADYMIKPFDNAELVRHVKDVLK
ncbi:response regulator transcription factor [Candidatus Altiarchaeota archaeon]